MLLYHVTFPRGLFLTCGFLWTILFRYGCSSDVYTSTAQIRNLINSEKRLTQVLQKYIIKEELRVERIKKVLEKLTTSGMSDLVYSTDDAAGHPVNAFLIIKHYVDLFRDVRNEDEALQNHKEFINDLQSSTFYLPDEEDLNGATNALLRLQRVYKIKTSDLVRGDVLGHESSPLSADDCFRIGERALEQQDYKLAHSWLATALQNNQTLTRPVSVVLTALARVHHRIEDYASAVNILSRASELDPENEEVKHHLEECTRTFQEASSLGRIFTTIHDYTPQLDNGLDVYERLCRGDVMTVNEPRERKTLLCRYRPTNVPYAPVKEELFSISPRIALLYDVISDQEADTVKELASPLLERATVGVPSGPTKSEIRISKVGWLYDNIHGEVIQRLSRRVSHVTGLDTTYRDIMSRAEPFQVVNYGLAGQYEPHVDYYGIPESWKSSPSFIQDTGDRMATFMFYLNDVTAGGATVFTEAMVRVPPVKGAAAFWYNAKKTGELDHRTTHAGCPVLLGEKWVANKWVHEVGQEFRRPCGQSEDQDYSIDE